MPGPESRPSPVRHLPTYLDGVDDRGRDAQAEQPLDGAGAVHVVLLHEGAVWYGWKGWVG